MKIAVDVDQTYNLKKITVLSEILGELKGREPAPLSNRAAQQIIKDYIADLKRLIPRD